MHLDIVHYVTDLRLCGQFFRGESWRPWIAFVRTVFSRCDVSDYDLELYRRCTARPEPPRDTPREVYVVAGRRAGKSRIAATIATYLATMRDYGATLAPGEVATIALIAADRRQARVLMRYVSAILHETPLRELVVREKAESIELATHTAIEVHTASYRAVRGYTIAAAILDEIAYWPTDEWSANPDAEILAALRPAMATVQGALLMAISSPYGKRGVLWDAYRRYYGRDSDRALVWQAPTRVMNPLIDQEMVEEEISRDPMRARAEYLAEFRDDVQSYISEAQIDACVDVGICMRRADEHEIYRAFVDPSGGARDSFALAIAHTARAESHLPARSRRVIIDVVREWRAPFDPHAVVASAAALLAEYRVAKVWGDAYAGEWVPAAFGRYGIRYERCELTRSELYLQLEPLLMTAQIRLPDLPEIKQQLRSLERRTQRGGRDTVDHPRAGHDDIANAVAGAAYVALRYDPYYVPIA